MTEPTPQELFSFAPQEESSRPADPAPGPHTSREIDSLNRVIANTELERIGRAVFSAGEAAYHWVIETDAIHWSANAGEVLGCDMAPLATGRGYSDRLDADNFTSRYDTVMGGKARDEGSGVPFQIEYLFRPQGRTGRQAVWLEDCGRWYAGADGRPVEVFGIIRRIDDRHRRDHHLSFLGNCDPLTGMMNRGRLTEALGEAISVAERGNTSCSFAIAAINNLAVVNDAYGFEVADEVIVALGRRLRQVVRAGDALARYSGSKFGIILNNCGEEDLRNAAERYLNIARESVIETERGPVWAMLSIGGVVLPRHAGEANTAMAHAEEALTEAKHLPSDGFALFKPSARIVSERDLNARCASEIVACLKQDRFQLAYQPIVNAATGETAMHEALLRMADIDGEIIAAAHLIPIAEKLGLVRLIDRNVVQLAVDTLLDCPDARIALNVSGITATDPRWFGRLVEIVGAHRDVARRLTIEIGETAALGDIAEIARFTAALRDIGCAVAIDDFSAGIGAFRNIRKIGATLIKIEGSLCDNFAANPDNRYFVRSLIDMARKFDIKTAAEWVQTPEDAAYLREWGADYLQGNLFGAPSLELPWVRGSDSAAPAEAPPPAEAAAEPPETSAGVADPFDVDLSRLRAAIITLDENFRSGTPEKSRARRPSFADLLGGNSNPWR